MSKYNDLIEGMNVTDIANDEGGYNYYGYVRVKGTNEGEWVIIRENTAQTEYRYAIGGSGYSTNWTNRASLTYIPS